MCEILQGLGLPALRLLVLTDVRSDSVLGGSLDIDALKAFAEKFSNTSVVNLPRLHAKVYVADNNLAVVSSANLTPAGLDSNYEYGIGITEPSVVARIRGDLEAYAQMGTVLDYGVLADLAVAGRELSMQYEQLERLSADMRRRFDERLPQPPPRTRPAAPTPSSANDTNLAALRAQVGTYSVNHLFSEAIKCFLSDGPLRTTDLYPRVQRLFPELCHDSNYLDDGTLRWHHDVRNAQQHLKVRGDIVLDGGRWSLTRRTRIG